jgi:hypothetical protein
MFTGSISLSKVLFSLYMGIGLCGFVVSQLTSQTTESLRFGDESDLTCHWGMVASRPKGTCS